MGDAGRDADRLKFGTALKSTASYGNQSLGELYCHYASTKTKGTGTNRFNTAGDGDRC